MQPPSTVRLKAHGKTVAFIHLGEEKIEFFLSHLCPELREELKTAVCQTSYVNKEETELTDRGLACKLVPTTKLDFNEIKRKVVSLIALRMDHFEKRPQKAKKNGRKQGRSRKKGYSNRALAT